MGQARGERTQTLCHRGVPGCTPRGSTTGEGDPHSDPLAQPLELGFVRGPIGGGIGVGAPFVQTVTCSFDEKDKA